MSTPSAANDARRRPGGEHDEIALGRLVRPHEPRRGRAGRSRRRARRSARAATPSAAAKSTRPAGRGNSARRPSCDETRGTNAGSTPSSRSASAVPGPTAATRGSGPLARRTSSRGPVRARHDHPVVALDVDRVVRSARSRSTGTRRPRGPAPRGARRAARPAPRGRVTTTFTRRGAASSDASATGSSPVRRSTQRPSGSATSAVSVSPSWWAAIGARQPPPIAATQARSSLDPARASPRRRAPPRGAPRRARTWSASAPWPASGSSSSGSKRWPISPPSPSRSRPHAASTTASSPRSPRLRSRVSMFPRSGSIDERRLEREQLRPPADRRGADPHPGLDPGRAAERVPRILARQVRADRRARQRPSRSCPSRSGPRRRCARRAAPPRAP